jgi:hypothetical protein
MLVYKKMRQVMLRSFCDDLISQSLSKVELISFLKIRNQDRCKPPLSIETLEEIVDHRLASGQISGLITFGKFVTTPDFRSILINKKLIFELTERQSWVLKWLVNSLGQGITRIPQRSIRDRLFQELSDIYESEGRDFLPQSDRLRDWVFRAGNSGDLMWGTLLKTTKGRDSRIYLDLDWSPDSSFL